MCEKSSELMSLTKWRRGLLKGFSEGSLSLCSLKKKSKPDQIFHPHVKDMSGSIITWTIAVVLSCCPLTERLLRWIIMVNGRKTKPTLNISVSTPGHCGAARFQLHPTSASWQSNFDNSQKPSIRFCAGGYYFQHCDSICTEKKPNFFLCFDSETV